MPLDFQDHVAAIRDARATKTITVPILAGTSAEDAKRAGVEIPEITLTYAPTALDAQTEDAFAVGRNFEGSMSLIVSVVREWDLMARDGDGNPIPWPLTRDGMLDLNDELPEAVIGIAGGILEDFSEGKGSRSGSRKASSTRKRR